MMKMADGEQGNSSGVQLLYTPLSTKLSEAHAWLHCSSCSLIGRRRWSETSHTSPSGYLSWLGNPHSGSIGSLEPTKARFNGPGPDMWPPRRSCTMDTQRVIDCQDPDARSTCISS